MLMMLTQSLVAYRSAAAGVRIYRPICGSPRVLYCTQTLNSASPKHRQLSFRGASISNLVGGQLIIESATMAPAKKSKKTADSINSRLALVMKSGKGKSSQLRTPNSRAKVEEGALTSVLM